MYSDTPIVLISLNAFRQAQTPLVPFTGRETSDNDFSVENILNYLTDRFSFICNGPAASFK